MTINFKERKKAKKPHQGQIMLRVTVNGKRSEISIKRKIDPGRWDSSTNRVRGNKEDAREVNSLIDSFILRCNRIYSNLIENNCIVSAKKIKEIFSSVHIKQPGKKFTFVSHSFSG